MLSFFFFNDTATTEIYTLSLHDALPICVVHAEDARQREVAQRGAVDTPCGVGPAELDRRRAHDDGEVAGGSRDARRSEEHTSELQSPCNLVCRLLLEKKNKHPHERAQ